jgi:hypothetical protein
MKEFMTNNGWIISYECHCGGVHRIEFVKGEIPGAIVKVYPKKGTWRASRKGALLKKGVTDNLETFINGLVA